VKYFSAVIFSLLVLGSARPAWSQDEPPDPGFAKPGAYIGIGGTLAFTLDGHSFDGRTAYKYVGGEELVILPRLNKKDMLRGVVGFRAPQFALEFSYDRSRQQGTFGDETVVAAFNAVNVDARIFFATRGRIQPHVVFGLAFPWLTIEDGSFLPPDSIGDATFRGQGLNTELGVTAFVHPRAGVSVGYAYRPLWFNRVRGVSNTPGQLRPRFRESSGSIVMMGFFTF